MPERFPPPEFDEAWPPNGPAEPKEQEATTFPKDLKETSRTPRLDEGDVTQ